MDRQETDNEARETKKTGNVLYWIIGLGLIFMIAAISYGFLRHDGDSIPKSDTPASEMMSDTVAGDGFASDTIATDVK